MEECKHTEVNWKYHEDQLNQRLYVGLCEGCNKKVGKIRTLSNLER